MAKTRSTKEVRFKLRTTLSNSTLAAYSREATKIMVGWIRQGRLPSTGTAPWVDDPECTIVAKPVAEDVGR